MNVILFGFKSCGKTTWGKIIADRLNRPFIDTDRLLEDLYFKQTDRHLNFREIFQTAGNQLFRALESDVVQQLKDIKGSIIATGGGMVLNPDNTALLAKLGQLVYLKVSKETLKRRILDKPELPAFFDPNDPEGSFEKMYTEREPKYEEIHAFSIDMETQTQDQVILEIFSLIQTGRIAYGQ